MAQGLSKGGLTPTSTPSATPSSTAFGQSDFSSVRAVTAMNAQTNMGLSPQGAQAFAQGNDVHLLSDRTALHNNGHLPHEAWHVVQQSQGRVKPTMQL